MKLVLEIFSYLSGEPRLNGKPAIKEEIEDVLSRPKVDITTLSRGQFIELLRADFLARGWNIPQPILHPRGGTIPQMELIKERVGLQLGFQSSALLADVLKFQSAYDHGASKIDVGVYVVGTMAFQNHMRRETGKLWAGLSFHEVSRKLPDIWRMVKVPICVMGLDVVEVEDPSATRNVNLMSPDQIKAIIFAFLEKKYGILINKNVRVPGIGKSADIEFDGIMHLDEIDIILEVEVSTEGVLRSRILADVTRSFARTLQDYERVTGRKAALRFILIGRFSPRYINKVIEERRGEYGESSGVLVDYKIHSLEELGLVDE